MQKIMLVIDDYQELVTLESFFRRLGFDVLSLGKDILVAGALLSFTPELLLATAKGRQVDGSKLALRLKKSAPGAKIALLYPGPNKPALTPESEMVIDALVELPWNAYSLIDITAKLLHLDSQPLLEKYDKIIASKLKSNEQTRVGGDAGSASGSDRVRVTGTTGLQAAGITSAAGLSALEGSSNNVGGSHSATGSQTANVMVSGGDGSASKAPGAGRTASASTASASAVAVTWDPIATPGMATRARSERSAGYDEFLKTHDDGPVDGVFPRAKGVDAMKKLKADSADEQAELEALLESKREFLRVMFREGAKKKKG